MARTVPLLLFLLLGSVATGAPAEAQSWRTITATRQVQGEEHLSVRVEYGAGRFDLAADHEGDRLYRIDLRYDEESFDPVLEHDEGSLRLGIQGRRGFDLKRRASRGRLDLLLTRDVPMDLRLEFGAVRAEMDLGGLALRNLRLSTGASESEIEVSEPNRERLGRARLEVGAADFSARNLGNLNAERIDVDAGVGSVTLDFDGEWNRDARVEVEMALGSLRLRFPEDLGVRLERDSFLTSFDPGGLIRRDGSYYSPAWETAERRVTVSVDAALGSVTVEGIR